MVGELFYIHRGRNRFQNIRHRLFRTGDDAERGSSATFENTHQSAANPILPNNILLRIVTVTHLGDIADCNLRTIDDLDRQLVQVVDTRRKSVDIDRILERAKLGRAAGEDERLIVDCGRDIALRQIFFLKLSGIEIDRDESRFAPERIRNRDTRNTDQADANLIERDVESLLFGKCGAADAVL